MRASSAPQAPNRESVEWTTSADANPLQLIRSQGRKEVSLVPDRTGTAVGAVTEPNATVAISVWDVATGLSGLLLYAGQLAHYRQTVPEESGAVSTWW